MPTATDPSRDATILVVVDDLPAERSVVMFRFTLPRPAAPGPADAR